MSTDNPLQNDTRSCVSYTAVSDTGKVEKEGKFCYWCNADCFVITDNVSSISQIWDLLQSDRSPDFYFYHFWKCVGLFGA